MCNKIIQLTLLVVIYAYSLNIRSQVTIGSGETSVKGALLQLKEQTNITDGAANSTKGLGMPRVYLYNLTNLSDIDPTNSTRPDPIQHVGLTVYNLNGCVNPADGYNGLYVWDGTKWEMIGSPRLSSNVQIYQDQDGNDFKAASFGAAGTWMVENLRASKYATNVTGQPDLTLGIGPSSATTPYYAYPGPSANGIDATYVTTQPSLGYLYNWMAASARVSTTSTDEANTAAQTQYQGICPNGWHLPSDYEWNQLEQQIANNPQLYSKYPAGATSWNTAWATTTDWRPSMIDNPVVSYANAMLGICKPIDFAEGVIPAIYGQSLPANKGGFYVVLAGFAQGGNTSISGYGILGQYWCSSSRSNANSWVRSFAQVYGAVNRSPNSRHYMLSVRCKKN